jgi:hypothetical protein
MGSRLHVKQIKQGPPLDYKDDIRAYQKEYAQSLDKQDPLRRLRNEFIIPSRADLKRRTLKASSELPDTRSGPHTIGHMLTAEQLKRPRNLQSTSVATPLGSNQSAQLNGSIHTSQRGLPKLSLGTIPATKTRRYPPFFMPMIRLQNSWHRSLGLFKAKWL